MQIVLADKVPGVAFKNVSNVIKARHALIGVQIV
jgi:hypothetical protein